MIKGIIPVSLALILAGFSVNKKESVWVPEKTAPYITGIAHGFKDSTWIYLEGLEPSKFLDSTRIMNERFTFSRKPASSDAVVYVVIRTRNYSDYVFAWLDDQPVTFSGVKGSFTQSIIIGSATQLINEQLSRIQEPIYKQLQTVKKNSDEKKIDKDETIRQTALLEEELRSKSSNFIAEHSGSIISVKLLSITAKAWGKSIVQELYANLSPQNQNSSYGEKIRKYLEMNRQIAIGEKFVDFEQRSSSGKMIRLSDLSGKLILLDFWAAWCGPCRKENPNLVRLYEQYKDKGFEIFGVSVDDNEKHWRKAIADDKLSWTQVSELNGVENSATLIYGVFEYPTNFLIDKSGRIIAKNLYGEELSAKLSELFSDKSSK